MVVYTFFSLAATLPYAVFFATLTQNHLIGVISLNAKKLICCILTLLLILLPAFAAFAEEGTAEPEVDLSHVYPEDPTTASGARGERTLRIQQRLKDLGYLYYRPTGYFMSLTKAAVIAFQNNQSIMADGAGVVGEETMDYLFSSLAKRKNVPPEGGGTPPEVNIYGSVGALLPWEDMDRLIAVGDSFQVIDLNTSITFTMTRLGGKGHMDVCTTDNTSYHNYLKIFSGMVSTNKRPVLIEYSEDLYAASLYGMPHGEGNGGKMNGHTCLYFSGSSSNALGLKDVEHDANVQKAAGLR